MQLIGYMNSPFVRRVAITMELLGIGYEHRELSIFRDFEEFRAINPLVKVPTVVLDNGRVLADSSLIINYLETVVAGRSLMPANPDEYGQALQQIGIALVAMEKVAGLIYETGQRPPEHQHQPWIDRLETQLNGAVDLMEAAIAQAGENGNTWLAGKEPGQADISTAVAWRFIQHIDRAEVEPARYPQLSQHSARAESLDAFIACPLNG
jgi:glutathione S-transferase